MYVYIYWEQSSAFLSYNIFSKRKLKIVFGQNLRQVIADGKRSCCSCWHRKPKLIKADRAGHKTVSATS